jgi:predicted DsbA family dithiol-disulfide isomerase
MLIDIWSDIACPWCAVGRARLRTALVDFPRRDDVTVRWRSFELDPGAPRRVEGDYVARLAAKYGADRTGARAMIERMVATAAAEGLVFDFDRIQPGNTFDAHRLVHLGADRGLQDAVKDRLLTAYLGEGAPIGDPATLAGLGAEAGLDAAEVAEVLGSDRYGESVRADERQAMAYGISAVPFFVLDGRLGVPGAQPPDVLRRALEQAMEAGQPVTVPAGHSGHDDAGACADGSCSL